MRCLPAACALLFGCTGVITHADDDDATVPTDGGVIPPQDPTYGTDHPRIYLAANHERLAAELQDELPAATRFRTMVDHQLGGADYYDFAASNAALIGQLTGDATYCTYAVAQSDAFVTSEEALITAGQRPVVANDSYLQIGPDVGDLMLTYDWCFDALTDAQRARWDAYAAQAVWNVWHADDATWGGVAYPWSGWAIDDPSDNYYYSFLEATMLFGLAAHDEEPSAAGWLDFFRTEKFQGELVPTFEADLRGGGSREGTGYGVSMMRLWHLYDLWQASTGEDLARQTTHTRASMLAMMHAIVPTLDRFAPTGDQSRDATASMFDYQRNYLQELAYLFPEDPVSARARWLIDHSSVPEMSQAFMEIDDFFYAQPAPETPLPGLGTVYHASGIGEVYARSGWDTGATWINLIAGPYTQSHAHQDQGHLMIYKGGWLAFDENTESHSGIEQGVEDHNLVRIVSGGATVAQRVGTTSSLLALHRGDGWVHIAADLLPAYGGSAAVSQDQREIVYLEPDTIVVFDRVTTASGTQQVWQLNAPVAPTLAGARATIANAGHTLQIDRITPTTATTAVKTWSTDSEYSGGYRLDETFAGGAQQLLHVLSIDGSVTSVAPSGATGVTITFGNGETATVRFGAAGVDGTLERGGSTVNLGPGVDSMPE